MATLDLRHIEAQLKPVFEKYPAGNMCDFCATEIGKILVKNKYTVQIVTIENERMPGISRRPPYIRAYNPERALFTLAKTGFHQANRIVTQEEYYYIDALVFIHFGSQAMDVNTYFDLFEYPDDLEITRVEDVTRLR